MATTTQRQSTKRLISSTLFLSVIALSLSRQQQVHAQATAPSPVDVFGPASARTSTCLYILGGFSFYIPAERNPLNQFFSLNLQTLEEQLSCDRNGLAPVMDPNTGLADTAGGCVNPTKGTTIDVLNFEEDSVSTLPIQDALNSVAEFVPSSKGWQTMNPALPRAIFTSSTRPLEPGPREKHDLQGSTPLAPLLVTSPLFGAEQQSTMQYPRQNGEKSNSVRGIVGGVIGGLAVVGAALSLLYRRRRLHSRTAAGSSHCDNEPKVHWQLQDKIGGGDDDDNNNVEVLRSQLQTQRDQHVALQQQVELLQTQHQASTSSPRYDSLHTYWVPVVTYPPPQDPKFFEPSTSPHNPSTLVSDFERAASSSNSDPVVYDSVTALENVVRPRRNPEIRKMR
ncbi:MAG: hypothetical protein J3R72DRAFT_497023 [Linnemannia gamsii]|nr:MAG: hypothetical protein J3R72DRAFT_497023 [Linnemannia gamsii]